jgi:hypothetical protein
MYIFKEKAGVISEKECWICIHSCYLYSADTLERLIEILNNEWEHDRHLAG